MQSPELLEQTASERLTLDQEYDMQQSWFQDENSKLFWCADPGVGLLELQEGFNSQELKIGHPEGMNSHKTLKDQL